MYSEEIYLQRQQWEKHFTEFLKLKKSARKLAASTDPETADTGQRLSKFADAHMRFSDLMRRRLQISSNIDMFRWHFEDSVLSRPAKFLARGQENKLIQLEQECSELRLKLLDVPTLADLDKVGVEHDAYVRLALDAVLGHLTSSAGSLEGISAAHLLAPMNVFSATGLSDIKANTGSP